MPGPGLPLKGLAAFILVYCSPKLPCKHSTTLRPKEGMWRNSVERRSKRNIPVNSAEAPEITKQRYTIPAVP